MMKPLQGQFSFLRHLEMNLNAFFFVLLFRRAPGVVMNHRREQRSRRLAADNFPDPPLHCFPLGREGIQEAVYPAVITGCTPTSSTSTSTAAAAAHALPAQAARQLMSESMQRPVPQAPARPEYFFSNRWTLGLSNLPSDCWGKIFIPPAKEKRIEKEKKVILI